MHGYLSNGSKSECVACGGCAQNCPCSAISMTIDEYGFVYPRVDKDKCISCNKCINVCMFEGQIQKQYEPLFSYGGYCIDKGIREKSTSGGAFSAICKAYAMKRDCVFFGSTSDRLKIYHTYVENINNINIFNSSKYGQSEIGESYKQVKVFLDKKKYVVFSGTPCQIAGLIKFLGKTDTSRLLTVEVLCTGIPSALFMKKYEEWCNIKYGSSIKSFNYRFTNKNKWDDQPTLVELETGKRIITARWFSNFYSIFLQRLMSRPSCNKCQFVTKKRTADITLSDLWGLDKEYPDLYDDGSGSSWIICNSEKGIETFEKARNYMIGHEVEYDRMRKYQRPGLIEKTVHPSYDIFMEDLKNMNYPELCKKWAKKPTLKLLFQKYVYNNRMRVRIWKLKQYIKH